MCWYYTSCRLGAEEAPAAGAAGAAGSAAEAVEHIFEDPEVRLGAFVWLCTASVLCFVTGLVRLGLCIEALELKQWSICEDPEVRCEVMKRTCLPF
jgi:hypothetical protein